VAWSPFIQYATIHKAFLALGSAATLSQLDHPIGTTRASPTPRRYDFFSFRINHQSAHLGPPGHSHPFVLFTRVPHRLYHLLHHCRRRPCSVRSQPVPLLTKNHIHPLPRCMANALASGKVFREGVEEAHLKRGKRRRGVVGRGRACYGWRRRRSPLLDYRSQVGFCFRGGRRMASPAIELPLHISFQPAIGFGSVDWPLRPFPVRAGRVCQEWITLAWFPQPSTRI
jgi:hypothetical protein